ncbi:MAG: E3 ubiquitin-protein ligase [Alphaproteobacteria bacterium]|nr:MAG: E3 ubiquitin-protein ligase [Alphaproteobacteria bacterium]
MSFRLGIIQELQNNDLDDNGNYGDGDGGDYNDNNHYHLDDISNVSNHTVNPDRSVDVSVDVCTDNNNAAIQRTPTDETVNSAGLNVPALKKNSNSQISLNNNTNLSKKSINSSKNSGKTTSVVSFSTCPICISDIDSNEEYTECYHIFHQHCLDEWKQNNGMTYPCPSCMRIITNEPRVQSPVIIQDSLSSVNREAESAINVLSIGCIVLFIMIVVIMCITTILRG